jgi:hypothetical protein
VTLDELDWLASERPTRALTATATTRARTALLDHIDESLRPPQLVAGPPRRRFGTRRSGAFGLATVAVAAAAAIVAISSLGGGGGGGALGTPNADAAPLVRLSHQVAQAPDPTGDATLVVRTHTFADGKTMTGADLYGDDGSYYYAETPAGLPGAIASVRAGDMPDDQGAGSWIGRETKVAIEAQTAPLAEARTEMANAALDPNVPPATLQAQSVATAEAKLKALGKTYTPVDPEVHTNGMIWSNSLDALLAGAGRPDVRAGVLRLLSTIPQVTVTHTTVNGADALVLSSRVFPDDYQEQLVIDAATGTPISFDGGTIGQAPAVSIAYQVTRVNVSDVAQG